MDHDAAIEVHVVGGICHFFSDEFILEAEEVMRIRKVGKEVAELAVKGRVFVILALQNAVFDAEGIEGIFAEGVFGDFRGPAREVFSVEERDPLGGLGGKGENNNRRGEGDFHRCGDMIWPLMKQADVSMKGEKNRHQL